MKRYEIDYTLKPNKRSLSKRKLLYGVGVNDSDYKTTQIINGKRIKCRFYDIWANMLMRCYSSNWQDKYPTYIGCTVCDEWLIFSNFKEWMARQDWEGKQLDKDLKIRGNKEYNPDTCIFVSNEINKLFSDCGANRGDYPQGVTFDKNNLQYSAQISKYGKKNNIGYFSNTDDAHKAYLSAKREYVLDVASKQDDFLKQILINHLCDFEASLIKPNIHP